MTEKTFGETLRSLRERENLSVKAVIKELKKYNQDITDKTLYSYESDKRAASADMLLALCQIYNCSNILETFAGIAPDYSIPDDQEWKIIEKYRDLDSYGRDVVNIVLDKEYKRYQEQKAAESANIIQLKEPDRSYLEPEAAHERTDIETTLEGRQHDDDIMNDDSEWE